MLDAAEHGLIVAAREFELRLAFLILVRPELEVADLMHGEKDHIEVVLPLAEELLIGRDGLFLDAELEATTAPEHLAIALAHLFELCEVGRIGTVREGASVLEAGTFWVVPVRLHAVVDPLCEAYAIEVEPDCIDRGLLHRIVGLGRVAGVDVAVLEHGGPFRSGKAAS